VWNAATVLVCALELLGRSEASFPPIAFVQMHPADVSARAEAYVRSGDTTIYLITSSSAFQRLQRGPERCGDLVAVKKLASVLVHEEWHVRHGPDERGAYSAQLMALRVLGAAPGNPVYREVQRSMQAVLRREPASAQPVQMTENASR